MEPKQSYYVLFLKGLGLVEMLVGLALLGYAGHLIYEIKTYPEVHWEGWSSLTAGLALWTGVGMVIAGLGLLYKKRWPFIFHLPLLAWFAFAWFA